jgi:hypothetical protein
MAADRCLGCGGAIELTRAYQVPDGVIARGDRLMHAGCVFDTEADTARPNRTTPAYFIPRRW